MTDVDSIRDTLDQVEEFIEDTRRLIVSKNLSKEEREQRHTLIWQQDAVIRATADTVDKNPCYLNTSERASARIDSPSRPLSLNETLAELFVISLSLEHFSRSARRVGSRLARHEQYARREYSARSSRDRYVLSSYLQYRPLHTFVPRGLLHVYIRNRVRV